MKIIAIASEKGGSGKTTSTMNIAARLADLNYRVLMVDLDPQGDLTTHAGYRPQELELTISHLFQSYLKRHKEKVDLPEMISNTLIPIRSNFDLLPSDVLMEEVDAMLVSAVSREFILKKILNIASERKPYDYILIDCRPTLSILTVNALTASDFVLIPVKAQYLDFVAFNLLYNNISLLREETNPKLRILGVFLTMYDANTSLSKKAYQAMQELTPQDVSVCQRVISQAVALAEASAQGQDIFTYEREGTAAQKQKARKSAEEYASLVDEFLQIEKDLAL